MSFYNLHHFKGPLLLLSYMIYFMNDMSVREECSYKVIIIDTTDGALGLFWLQRLKHPYIYQEFLFFYLY